MAHNIDDILKKFSSESNAATDDNIDDILNDFSRTNNGTDSVEEPKKLSAYDRLLQVGSGVTGAYAGLADLTNRTVGYYGGKAVSEGLKYLGFDNASKAVDAQAEQWGESDITSASDDMWNKAAGKDITPTDSFGKFLKTTGEFAAPLPIKGGTSLSTAIKGNKGAKVVSNLLDMAGKSASRSVGASAALTLADCSFASDGSAANEAICLFEAIAGGAVGEQLYGSRAKIMQSLGKTAMELSEKILKPSNVQESFVDNVYRKPVGKMLSKTVTDSESWRNLIEDAKKEGVTLPFNVALGGGKKDLIANNYLKSYFASQTYRDVIKNADKSMVNSLVNIIEDISPEELKRFSASTAASDFLKEENIAVKAKSRDLYDIANEAIKSTDSISLKNTKSTIEDMKIKLSSSPVPSDAEKFVLKKISELENSSLMSSDKASLSETISARKSLNASIHYEKDIPGIKNFINGITNSMEKDIETTANKSFLESYKDANFFFKQNVVDRLRTVVAASLMREEAPKMAFSYMNSVQDIKLLEKALGESSQAKDILQGLKRAKASEIIYGKVITGGSEIATKEGHINYGALSHKIMSSKEELLEELLGKESMQSLKRLSNIASSFYSSGRAIGTNTSLTGIASSDINEFKNILNGTIGAISTIVAGGSYYATHSPGLGVAVGAAATAASINGFSRILSDRKIINYAIQYAKANTKNEISTMNKVMGLLDEHMAMFYKGLDGDVATKILPVREAKYMNRKHKKDSIE